MLYLKPPNLTTPGKTLTVLTLITYQNVERYHIQGLQFIYPCIQQI
ncbi:Uncharacterised protein [Yersinia intermedia]|nr:Uncharacterised protein [Yersinia intermedia]